MPRLLTLQRPAQFVAAGVSAAWCFVALDLIQRGSAPGVPASRHLAGALALYALVGTLCGGMAWALALGEGALTRRLLRRRRRAARWVRVALYGALAAAASWHTSFWAFTGPKASAASYASYGPYVLIAVSALTAGVLAWAWPWAIAALRSGKRIRPLLLLLGGVLAAAAASWVDLHVLVALYAPLHTALEVVAAVLLFLVSYALLSMIEQSSALVAMRVLAGVGLAWTVLFIVVRSPRVWLSQTLGHVWTRPVYVGRMLQREQAAEILLAHPHDWQSPELRRLDTLRERYGGATGVDPAWERPLSEPPGFRAAIRRLRGHRHDYNVLVYYVDTLRYDAASDPGIMPHVAAFGRHALDFRHTYSAGSDTLRALPSLTSGSYEPAAARGNSILQVARRTGRQRVIAIAKSAHEFLGKLDPSFKFDQALVVPDYSPDRKDVWGYGADRSTAKGLVDSSLSWLRDHPGKPFFMWLFNFDQHDWRELNKSYVYGAARRYKVPDKGKLNWRYRVVATGIDAQFARLLSGLRDLGLADNTIVLFVADHGEGLGREGFWVHGVFLWQCLMHVPLMIRVPGLEPRAIDDKVSLVDVAPTLARYLERDPDTAGYQGEDLLGYLVPDRPPRRLPLLLTGFSQRKLARVGIVEPDKTWKLVLTLDSNHPELYDLTAPDPDAASVAAEHPGETARLMGDLVRSPIFPRPAAGVAMQAGTMPAPGN